MATRTATQETTLRLQRTFAAPRDQVFKAWTDPQALTRWFAPSDAFTTPIAEVDLKVGGRYRIQMKAPDGQFHTVAGVYREIVSPSKLVFTWAWEDGGCGSKVVMPNVETVVTVEFHQRGPATEMTLTHEYFPNAEERDRHGEGWTGCLSQLAKMF